MERRKRVYLFLPFFIAFALIASGISYADVDVPDVKRPVPIKKPVPSRKPVSKPYGEVSGGQSLSDVLKRIEALESRSGGGNVSAPKIRGIKMGGSLRHRFELQQDFLGLVAGANTGRTTEDFTLQRFRLYFDVNVNKNVRGYFKLQDVRTFGIEESSAGNGTVGNLGRVDLLEGYVELRNLGDLTPALENISVRIGRWQWFYGDHRLIGHLNWANEGRSYDGARVRWEKDGNWIDAFGAQIDEFDTGSDAASGEVGFKAGVTDATGSVTQNGRGNQDEVLFGFYSHFKVTDGLAVEPYMINRFRSRDQSGAEGAAAQAGEKRYTLGARIVGKKIPSLPGLDFTFEQAFQFGDTEPITGANASTDMDISAFAGAWGVGYTFSNVAWSPRIGYQFALAEGDDNPNDDDNDTFDHLYPTGHARMGYIDAHAWQNIQAHKIMLTAKPSKKLLLKADLWFFEADEEVDAMYSVVGGVSSTGNTSSATRTFDDEYGTELDLVFKYKLFKNFGVVGGYSRYWVGDYIEDARKASLRPSAGGDDANADWFWLQTTLKF